MAIAIGQITLVDVLDGEQGLPGVPGAQGPAGTPGFLGLIVSGSTLSLKGYDADGILQASIGYIYIDGSRYAVPEYSLTLTNSGQGYILFNPNWIASVRFAKMFVDDSNIVYKDYNTFAILDSNAYIIGRFNRDSIIYNAEVLNPQTTQSFQISKFMEILNSGDVNDINRWAAALGITQVFESIAVLKAFVDKLTVNRVESPDYEEDSSGIPTDGYLLDSVTKMMKAVNAVFYNLRVYGGTFEGSLIHDSFETVEAKTGAPITIPAKTRWSTDELYTALAGTPSNTPSNFWSNIANGGIVHCCLVNNCSMYLASGASVDLMTHTSKFSGTATIYIDSFSKSYGNNPTLEILINSTRVWLKLYDSGSTADAWSKAFTIQEADVVVVRFVGDSSETLVMNSRIQMSATYDFTGKFQYDNPEYNLVEIYKKGTFYSTAVSFSSPVTFNSSSHIDFVGLDSLLTQLSSYPNNALTNITGSFYVNGNLQTVTSFYKTPNFLSIVFSNAPTLEMHLATAEGTSLGFYNISGSFNILSDIDSVKSKSLIPFVNATSNITTDGTDLGSAAKKIRNINMAGDIYGGGNIGGFANITGSNVWGAVFN